MNIEEFIDQCRDQWAGFDDFERLALHEHPRDRYLSSLPREIQGMATENKLMLLNLAMRNLAPGEVYVEIGCWHGLSLAGAAVNNASTKIYACDDFSQFSGTSAQLQKTIKEYTIPEQVLFSDMDFLSFLDLAPWQPARIGAYFYDGGHTFQQQYQALEHVLPWLAEKAIVIIDDTNAGQVRSANKLFMSRAPGFHLLTDVRTPGNGFPTWWNGFQVYIFQSKDMKRAVQHVGLRYHVSRFFWDSLMPPAREIKRWARLGASKVPGLKALYGYCRQRRSSGKGQAQIG